jgi:hypothetical protein
MSHQQERESDPARVEVRSLMILSNVHIDAISFGNEEMNLMAQVKVWNDGDYEYRETFKDQDIRIPAHGFIEMEYYDAYEFKGTYKSIQRDSDNQPLPHCMKKIRVEEIKPEQVDAKIEANTCVACKFRAASPKELFDHTVANHSHQVVVDEEAEKELTRKKKAV